MIDNQVVIDLISYIEWLKEQERNALMAHGLAIGNGSTANAYTECKVRAMEVLDSYVTSTHNMSESLEKQVKQLRGY